MRVRFCFWQALPDIGDYFEMAWDPPYMVLPRIGENVVLRSATYKVRSVTHHFEENYVYIHVERTV